MKYAISLLCFGLFIWQAGASCRIRARANVVNAVNFVVVPLYSVSYQAPEAQKEDQLKKLEEQLKLLQEQINALRQPKVEQLKQNPTEVKSPDFLGLFRTNCASCHDKAVSQAKGGKFIITDGAKLASTITERQARRMATRTYLGSMPPNKPLSDDKVGIVMQFVDSLK